MPPKIAMSDDEDSIELSDIGDRSEELSDVQVSDDIGLGDEEDEESNSNEMEELQNDWYTPKVHAKERRTRGAAGGVVSGDNGSRETRKRQLTMYEEDDVDDEEEEEEEEEASDEYLDEPPKKKVSVKLRIPRRSAGSAREDVSESPYEEEFDYAPDATPDVSKLTERQRARLAEEENGKKSDDTMFQEMDEQLLALNRKTQKKEETAEEIAVRKAENARRRADYKVKQLEEEKRDTLNKLLKRRAVKTRDKDEDDLDSKQTTLKPRRPNLNHPALIRWVCKPESSVLGLNE
ncbi:hypothetical protein FT663_03994 [Candidozyma haemuli var. vulneris]|uniref:INO80 complex subunit B-like conserved region domain-containing protein n=1 Tax=Candidozyma haemuli TaxID=45357 RepID=A0A2V1ATT6_9ASCO|nr:hypothetical protein CXQ85_000559 [[Candida] haemuloni]KAF3986363.1 hypothetical protein FT662_04616 [[Candida] haemuloni var. vulneris]KAF3988525.1 hypothetical protein FT663_03994 [[Candida] haemuloni var. vulneris]PVH21577.1 hypothetical protein CXQ85_000559 [[Candida] haemuloni]